MKKKQTIKILLLIIILFIVLKLFLGGPYLYNLLEESILVLIIIWIISIIMMFIPSILRIKNKQKFEYKKGKKICLINSILLYIISIIPCLKTILKNNNIEQMSFDPIIFAKQLIVIFLIITIVYYFINMSLFVYDKKQMKQ